MSAVVLGVAGGIAAYKACGVLRRLREAGHDVTVVPTRHALDFVGRATWEALSGKPVTAEVFDDVPDVRHVALGRSTELVLVAPATADLLARAVAGRADDLLTSVLLTATCPVVMFPAMHTEMWHHPATRANVATLRERGVIVVDPASGRLTGADSGPGRLPEPWEITDVALGLAADPRQAEAMAVRDLAGRRVVISAGGTHEYLDPVRFLGNASSGRTGIALAQAAALRGADVELVCANVSLPTPSGCRVTTVTSTADLADAVGRLATDADVVIMAAAPADFTPAEHHSGKIKKESLADGKLTVELTQTTDVLASLGRDRRPGQVIVGFAAETAGSREALVDLARRKRERKGCDLIVANDVSGGAIFGSAETAVIVIGDDGVVAEAAGDKQTVAHHILDAVGRALPSR